MRRVCGASSNPGAWVDLSPTTRNRIHRLSGGYWVARLKAGDDGRGMEHGFVDQLWSTNSFLVGKIRTQAADQSSVPASHIRLGWSPVDADAVSSSCRGEMDAGPAKGLRFVGRMGMQVSTNF